MQVVRVTRISKGTTCTTLSLVRIRIAASSSTANVTWHSHTVSGRLDALIEINGTKMKSTYPETTSCKRLWPLANSVINKVNVESCRPSKFPRRGMTSFLCQSPLPRWRRLKRRLKTFVSLLFRFSFFFSFFFPSCHYIFDSISVHVCTLNKAGPPAETSCQVHQLFLLFVLSGPLQRALFCPAHLSRSPSNVSIAIHLADFARLALKNKSGTHEAGGLNSTVLYWEYPVSTRVKLWCT